MTNATKRRAIIFFILTALITVMLAVALPQLELQKGVPLPGETKSQFDAAPSDTREPPVEINANTFLRTIFGLFVILLFIFYLSRLRRGGDWRGWIRPILALAVFSLFITLFLYSFSNVSMNMTLTAPEVLPNELVLAGPALAPVPVSLFWVVWIALGALLLLVVIGTLRVRVRPKIARDPLAQEAKDAVEALQAGQDFSNVIIRCYHQMSQVLKKERGLTLEETMTAREFEALLEKRGVPNPPVRQLTRLFEIARYAARTPGHAEEAQAIDCLNAIAQYSQKNEARRSR